MRADTEPPERKRIGLIVNPIAGMGGSVGLKGTDAGRHRQAQAMGAKPVAPARARAFLSHVHRWEGLRLLVAPGIMGGAHVGADVPAPVDEIGTVSGETSGEDTRRIAAAMETDGVDLIVFVGGDGTARDICDAVDLRVPVIGVPSGVKVYSALFATSPASAADLLDAFVDGAELGEEEVLDIDEEAFRKGILDTRLYGYLRVPELPERLQGGKEASGTGSGTLDAQKEIAEFLVDSFEHDTLYLLGPGTTLKAVADVLGIEKTLLGVDAVFNGEVVGKDLNERSILGLLERYPRGKIVVTPLGGNGFVFGRGNRQFTPEVIRRVGLENLVVVATRDKLARLKCLRVDTDDADLNRALAAYMDVIVGYKYSKVMPVEQ